MSHLKPTFNINTYDSDGDLYEEGIFLNFDILSIRICDGDIKSFENFINYLIEIKDDIKENYQLPNSK